MVLNCHINDQDSLFGVLRQMINVAGFDFSDKWSRKLVWNSQTNAKDSLCGILLRMISVAGLEFSDK